MSAKKPAAATQGPASNTKQPPVQPWSVSSTAAAPLPIPPRTAVPDMLLVCLQDPFDGVGDSSTIVHAEVPAADGNSSHLWQLETVLSINPPRFFAGWATRGSFTLDLSVHAAASPAAGTWGGIARTTSGTGNCRVLVMRDSTHKVRFSLATGARHAPEKAMPLPDESRFLNADIAFELNGSSGLSAGAVAVISNKNWSHLIAGSTAPTQGLAFDGKWRHNLAPTDGDATVTGAWAFAVMTQEAYEALCENHGWMPHLAGDT